MLLVGCGSSCKELIMALSRFFSSSLCLVLAAGLAFSLPLQNNGTNSDDKWDYILFVQRSPGGICYYEDGHDCSYPPNVTTWTMHGAWPTLNDTLGPNWCNPDAEFSLHAVEDILPQLVSQWTNLEPDTAFDSFWSHEWLKHGTCASGVSSMETEKGFFSTVLELQEKMNFTVLLSSQGIYPSYDHDYWTDDFNNAFMKTMGVTPLLECQPSKDGYILSQISVCLHKDLSIMPCAPYVFQKSTDRCHDDKSFRYIPKKTELAL